MKEQTHQDITYWRRSRDLEEEMQKQTSQFNCTKNNENN